MKCQFSRIKDFVFQEECTGIIALQKFAGVNRRLHCVVEGILYCCRKAREVVLEDEAEGFSQKRLHISFLSFSTLH